MTCCYLSLLLLFSFNDPSPTKIYTLSLHDALPILNIPKHPANDEKGRVVLNWIMDVPYAAGVQFSGLITAGTGNRRSEEHTSELQSLRHLVCRLLLEKKKKKTKEK